MPRVVEVEIADICKRCSWQRLEHCYARGQMMHQWAEWKDGLPIMRTGWGFPLCPTQDEQQDMPCAFFDEAEEKIPEGIIYSTDEEHRNARHFETMAELRDYTVGNAPRHEQVISVGPQRQLFFYYSNTHAWFPLLQSDGRKICLRPETKEDGDE